MSDGRHILDARLAAAELGEILKTGALVPLYVTGTSMVPFLRHKKDMVYLRSPESLPPKKHDIVFFERETGEVVLHRIYAIANDGSFVINGDAQNWAEQIKPEQVLATVEKISRNGGKMFSPRRLDWKLLTIIWRALLPFRPRILKLLGKIRRRK